MKKVSRSLLIDKAEKAGQEVHDYISRYMRENVGIELIDDIIKVSV